MKADDSHYQMLLENKGYTYINGTLSKNGHRLGNFKTALKAWQYIQVTTSKGK